MTSTIPQFDVTLRHTGKPAKGQPQERIVTVPTFQGEDAARRRAIVALVGLCCADLAEMEVISGAAVEPSPGPRPRAIIHYRQCPHNWYTKTRRTNDPDD